MDLLLLTIYYYKKSKMGIFQKKTFIQEKTEFSFPVF